MSKPWYRDGLRFQCTRCGNCCTGAPGFVWVNEDEIAAIAKFRGEEIEHTRATYVRLEGHCQSLKERDNGDCVFYDRQRGCTIYPVRPRQCRTWPFWESNVVTPDGWKTTCQKCPGAGTGDLISEEEIIRRLNVIRL